MEQEILKSWQKKVIEFIAKEDKLNTFYLTGGTALAGYYLHHRISDDLDFFSYDDFDPTFIHGISDSIRELLGASGMRFSRLYDRNQFFYSLNDEEIKIEFTRYPFKQIRALNVFDGVNVDSDFDIAVNKLMTIVDRFDPKDFADLYFLLQRFTLNDLRIGVEEKFNTKLDSLTLGGSFSKSKNILALPKMIKDVSGDELRDFFSGEAKKLSSDILM